MGNWTAYSEPAYAWLVSIHLALGALALVLFWVNVFSRKGAAVHLFCGKLFVSCVYAVAASALVVAAYRMAIPLSPEQLTAGESAAGRAEMAGVNQNMRLFLAYLALVAVIHARHGVRVIRTRHNPRLIDTRVDRSLAYGLVVGAAGMVVLGLLDGPWLRVLFLLLSPLGLVIAWDILAYLREPLKTPKNWWYAHMDAMIGCGVTLHTAFAAVGAGRFLNLNLNTSWALLPIVPLLVGTVATRLWIRHYQKKFGELVPRVRPDPVPLADGRTVAKKGRLGGGEQVVANPSAAPAKGRN
jgi:hypothetical protein